MKRSTGLALLLVLLAMGAVGLWLAQHLESYTETINHGPSPEARHNPFLAAEHYLKARGLVVSRLNQIDQLDRLDPQRSSLLMLDPHNSLTPSQIDALLDWVGHGGRLLFVAEALWDPQRGRSDDLLLDRLHLQQTLTRDLPDTHDVPQEPFPTLTKLYLENESAPAYFSFDPGFHLDDPEDLALAWANSQQATHLMQLRHGEGLVTVVTDSDLWRNDALAHFDNAWLLWYLNQGRDVALLGHPPLDNLLALAWRYFPQTLSLIALLALTLPWYLGLRRGPLHPEPTGSRRSLREHLAASARLVVRHRGQAPLLDHLRQDLLRRARHRHPGFEQLPVTEQWLVLSRLTGQPTRIIGQSLNPPPQRQMSRSEFCRHVAQLQQLRNAL